MNGILTVEIDVADITMHVDNVLLIFDERSLNWNPNREIRHYFMMHINKYIYDKIRVDGQISLLEIGRLLDVNTSHIEHCELYIVTNPDMIQVFDEGDQIVLFITVVNRLDFFKARD